MVERFVDRFEIVYGFEPHGFEPHGFEPHGFEIQGVQHGQTSRDAEAAA
jgi:hypothetical protein